MRTFSKVNAGITWWKVAIPVLTIIILLFKFHSGNFTAGGGFIPKGVTWKDIFAAIPAAGIVFAYLGFEQADQLAGEVKNPQKNLPRAIILAILIGTAIYVLLQVVFIGAMPPALLTHGFGAIACPTSGTCPANVATVVAGPFAGVAGLIGLGFWATILYIDAFVSPFGTGLMYVTSTSRVGYGLARNRYYPQVFQKVDANGIPWVSLIFAFLFGLVFLLPFPSWHSLVSLVTGASVLMYAGAPLSMGAFRRTVPEASRPYRVPAGAVLGPIGFIIANLIIYWSGLEAVWKLGVCIVIGYILIGICMAFDKQRPPLDWKSAQWLPVYLIGLGIITWQGQFSGGAVAPPVNTGHIPFWWDMLVVTIFSLVIYYWAMATRLPRNEMMNLVNRQAAPSAIDETPMHH
jgi:amino acid transporter